MADPIPLTRAHRVAVIGGGPGGLMAAEVLATAGASVTVFERMPSAGRKLLLAGRGGLNLTHSEPVDDLLGRYGPARAILEPAIAAFGPGELRAWCAGLGQEPFVGSSGRVFPAGLRATPLLRAWLQRLDELHVTIEVRHAWRGWADAPGSGTDVVVADRDGVERVEAADSVVLALGGASWPRVGSDGGWVPVVAGAGIEISPLQPANVGFDVQWTSSFASRFAGTPVKNVAVSAPGGVPARGDLMVTLAGVEGGAVYAVGRDLRGALAVGPQVVLAVDLLPDLPLDAVADRLARRRPKDSTSTALRRALGLAPVATGLLREVTGNRLPGDAAGLAALIKAVPVVLTGVQPIGRAISTAGGVALGEVDASFMLRRRPGTFVAGEMLDWEAPTGGYLLQATFSTAVAAAHGATAWITAS